MAVNVPGRQSCWRLEAVDDNTGMTVRPGGVYRFRHYMLNVLPRVWEVEIVDWREGRSYTDQVEYQSPAKAPSDWLIVRPYMRRIFMARHANMRSLLGAAS